MRRLIPTLLFLLASIIILSAQTPVAYYSFDGHAKDSSEFNNHAAVHAANLTTDRFGLANRAFHFDGSQSYLLAMNADHLNSPTTTIAFWVNPEQLPEQGESYLVSFGGWQERFKASVPGHGKVIWTTNSDEISNMDAGDGNELMPGTWTHVAMVHDGTNDIIYINGMEAAVKEVTGDLNTTDGPLSIGFDAVGNGSFFNGSLDEVMIFDSALTETQISDLYDTQATEPEVGQGMVAAYYFDQFGADASGFQNVADISTAELTTDRFGFGNSALELNGSTSEVTASSAGQLNSATTTVGFWVKVNELPEQGEVYLLSFGGWQERFKISLPAHGKPVWSTNSSVSGNVDLDSGDGNELVPGQWTYLVMVHDGTTDKIYMNGMLVGEKASEGDLNPTTHPLGIGFNVIDGGNHFNGVIDDIEIYNYALDDQAIADNYAEQSQFPGTEPDLVADYNLNGSGQDASIFHNHATLLGDASPIPNRNGLGGNALTGAVRADNSIALQSDYTTISFWVKPNSLPATGEVYLLSNGGFQERWKISLPSHGKPVFTTFTTACCSDLDSGDGNELDTSEWTHLVMVHDSLNDKIYVNGTLANETSSPGALNKTAHPLGIGYDPIDSSSFFDGAIDDVQIYNRALSDEEILALYDVQNDSIQSDTALVANYTFTNSTEDETEFQNDAFGMGFTLAEDRFGIANRAVAFDGESAFLQANNSSQLNSDFTSIAFWAKVNSLPESGEVYLLSFGGFQERWKISLPNHGKPVFTTYAASCCIDMDSGDGNELVVGEWKHVVMTHDGTVDRIYIDGNLANEATYEGPLNDTEHPLGIGYDPIGNGSFFDGCLDEVRIYNRALTEEEVADLYDLQTSAPEVTDSVAPCAPMNLMATVEFTNVELSWLPATDDVGVAAYNVYQDSVLISTTTDISITIIDLAPLTEYEFGVTAVDSAGNESLMTTTTVTTGQDAAPDTIPPTPPGDLTAEPGSNSILVSWSPSTDDRQVAGYVILLDGVLYDSVSANAESVLITGLETETLYTIEVYAYDLSGNDSELAEVTVSTVAPLETDEPGLVAHYPFEGDANDATPYNNHGEIGGDPEFRVAEHDHAGDNSMYLHFDGNRDSVFVPNGVHLISDYTTVSFWIMVDSVNSSYSESYVLDFGHWDQRWKVSLPQHQRIVWTTNGFNDQFTNFVSDMDSGEGNELVEGFWWYVTMVHDGEFDIIYINGQEVNRKPVPTILNSTARPFVMGSDPIGGGLYFSGCLDEVKIYNKALTAEEIASLFASGTTGIKDFAIEKYGNIKAMPNPATDYVDIVHEFTVEDEVSIRVFDNQGRQLDRIQPDLANGRVSINIHNYPDGIYYVNFVVDGENIGSLKFSKI